MNTRCCLTCGLILALAFATAGEAAPKGKATVRSVGGVNEYTYTGPKKKKKVVKEETPAPSLTLAEGQAPAPPTAMAETERPTTTTYGPATTAPQGTYTQTHIPGNPAATHQGTYTQTYSPGPNTGKAANGFFTPGGSQILSTAPIYYPFPYAGGGGGWGGGAFQMAPGYNGYNRGYNNGCYNQGYNCSTKARCDAPVTDSCAGGGGGNYQGAYNGPWQPPAYNPPAYNPAEYNPGR